MSSAFEIHLHSEHRPFRNWIRPVVNKSLWWKTAGKDERAKSRTSDAGALVGETLTMMDNPDGVLGAGALHPEQRLLSKPRAGQAQFAECAVKPSVETS